jgi:hypothetical protein
VRGSSHHLAEALSSTLDVRPHPDHDGWVAVAFFQSQAEPGRTYPLELDERINAMRRSRSPKDDQPLRRWRRDGRWTIERYVGGDR